MVRKLQCYLSYNFVLKYQNANEVIANRALELLGKKKKEYDFLHPNNDVNNAQVKFVNFE